MASSPGDDALGSPMNARPLDHFSLTRTWALSWFVGLASMCFGQSAILLRIGQDDQPLFNTAAVADKRKDSNQRIPLIGAVFQVTCSFSGGHHPCVARMAFTV